MHAPVSRSKPQALATELTALATLIAALAGCGGGSAGTAASDTSLLPSSSAPNPAPATPPSTQQALLPLPASIANGSIVSLECGRTYQGTLDLKGKSDVTVRTTGGCGNAVLTPGQPVSGWSRHQGDIFSAPVSFGVAQVILDGRPLELAHWPNRPQTWTRATASSAASLTHAMPNSDLVGATLVFKPYVWAVEARRVTAYSGTTMSVAALGTTAADINFDGYALGGAVDFYVEGKLWMLDAPGEWALRDGRLFVWAPDGRSPEGRVWVSPDRHGVDASNSRGVNLEGLSIYGAANGIHAAGASNLRVANVSIANSSANGIENSGGSGLQVDGATIRNTRHNAISVHWGGGAESVRNSRIEASGSIGMPTHARAAINLTASSGAVVHNNSVSGSGYIGVRVFRNATVSSNTVDGACLVLTDCGGVVTAAPDKAALNTRIENNTIRNVGPDQRLAWGIYLSDSANAVTVAGNRVSGSGNGMEILNGFDNRISGNVFSGNTQAHIQMVEFGSTPAVTNNVVNGNTFTIAGREEVYRLSSEQGTTALGRFGSYADNSYISTSSIFANYNGEALSFSQWQARTGQDAGSTLRAP